MTVSTCTDIATNSLEKEINIDKLSQWKIMTEISQVTHDLPFRMGERVEARHSKSNQYRVGQIVAVHREQRLFDVSFDEGGESLDLSPDLIKKLHGSDSADSPSHERKEAPEESLPSGGAFPTKSTDSSTPEYRVGDQVEALRNGGKTWRFCIVAKVHGNLTYDVVFSDRSRENNLPGDLLRGLYASTGHDVSSSIAALNAVTPSQPASSAQPDLSWMVVGAQVEARFHGGATYFPGTITKVSMQNNTVDMAYEDGDTESFLPMEYVRLKGQPDTVTVAKQPAKQKSMPLNVDPLYPVGTAVEGNYHGKNRWYPGVVTQIRVLDADTIRYAVRYNDGDTEDNLAESNVRMPKLRQLASSTPATSATVEKTAVAAPAAATPSAATMSFEDMHRSAHQAQQQSQHVAQKPNGAPPSRTVTASTSSNQHHEPANGARSHRTITPAASASAPDNSHQGVYFAVGTRVEVNVRGRGVWQRATVLRANQRDEHHATHAHTLDLQLDGVVGGGAEEIEHDVPVQYVRAIQAPQQTQSQPQSQNQQHQQPQQPQQQQPQQSQQQQQPMHRTPTLSDFRPGDRVYANFRSGGLFYPATVRSVHRHRRCLDLRYDDGDEERLVSLERVVLWSEATQLLLQQQSEVDKQQQQQQSPQTLDPTSGAHTSGERWRVGQEVHVLWSTGVLPGRILRLWPETQLAEVRFTQGSQSKVPEVVTVSFAQLRTPPPPPSRAPSTASSNAALTEVSLNSQEVQQLRGYMAEKDAEIHALRKKLARAQKSPQSQRHHERDLLQAQQQKEQQQRLVEEVSHLPTVGILDRSPRRTPASQTQPQTQTSKTPSKHHKHQKADSRPATASLTSSGMFDQQSSGELTPHDGLYLDDYLMGSGVGAAPASRSPVQQPQSLPPRTAPLSYTAAAGANFSPRRPLQAQELQSPHRPHHQSEQQQQQQQALGESRGNSRSRPGSRPGSRPRSPVQQPQSQPPAQQAIVLSPERFVPHKPARVSEPGSSHVSEVEEKSTQQLLQANEELKRSVAFLGQKFTLVVEELVRVKHSEEKMQKTLRKQSEWIKRLYAEQHQLLPALASPHHSAQGDEGDLQSMPSTSIASSSVPQLFESL